MTRHCERDRPRAAALPRARREGWTGSALILPPSSLSPGAAASRRSSFACQSPPANGSPSLLMMRARGIPTRY